MKNWIDHEGVSTVEVGPFLIHLDQPRPDAEWRLICPNVMKCGPVNLGNVLGHAKMEALALVAAELRRTLTEIGYLQTG